MASAIDGNKSVDKAKKKSEESKKKSEDIYVTAGRRIARCIDLCCQVDKLVNQVRVLQQAEASAAGELDEDDMARRVREVYLRKIPEETLVPCFKEVVEDPSHIVELMQICSKMNQAIKSMRSSDATGLKASIPRYALPEPHDPTSLILLIINVNGRAEMGLNHPILAWWLCPMLCRYKFDTNPEQGRKDLASGMLPMRSDDFPTLFWSGKLPGDDFIMSKVRHGAFKSYFLVRVARHIFLGPQSVIPGEDRKKSCACNADLHDMMTIEPEHIAYVCVQAHFGISLKSQWCEVDGIFNYYEMYNAVIKLIKTNLDTEWKDELLRWWNKEIFGNENGHVVEGTTQTSALQPSMMTLFQVQAEGHLSPMLDPSLFAEPSTSEPHTTLSAPSLHHQMPSVPTTSTSFAQGPSAMPTPPITTTLDMNPIPSVMIPARASSSGSGSAPTCTADSLPVTPHRTSPQTTGTGMDSPLSEEGDDALLTPIMNRKGTLSVKARGKRPALADGEAGESSGRTKRCRRSHK